MIGSKIREIISRLYREAGGWKSPDFSASPLDYLSGGDLLEEPFWRRYGLTLRFNEKWSSEPEPSLKMNCFQSVATPAISPVCCPASNG
jgi:hypothetical protein